MSSFLVFCIQNLAIYIGVVTGYHFAEIYYSRYKKIPRWILGISKSAFKFKYRKDHSYIPFVNMISVIEIGIIGSSMQHFIGTFISIEFFIVLITSNKVSDIMKTYGI